MAALPEPEPMWWGSRPTSNTLSRRECGALWQVSIPLRAHSWSLRIRQGIGDYRANHIHPFVNALGDMTSVRYPKDSLHFFWRHLGAKVNIGMDPRSPRGRSSSFSAEFYPQVPAEDAMVLAEAGDIAADAHPQSGDKELGRPHSVPSGVSVFALSSGDLVTITACREAATVIVLD